MRVIAGSLRGRTIAAPKGDRTRPTTDRVRESLFSALASRLGSDLGGGRVLDAFAGSGALGIEALSRGARSATFAEKDPAVVRVLRRNLESLGLQSESRVVTGDAFALAASGALGPEPFALLLLDPPYRLSWCDIEGLTSALARHGLLSDGAVIAYEHASGATGEWGGGFDLVSRKKYGTTEIDIVVYQTGGGSS